MKIKSKTLSIALITFIFIIGLALNGSISLAKSKFDPVIKSQILNVPSLFKAGLKDGDSIVKFSTLVHTNKVEVELKSLTGFPTHYHELEDHFLYVLKGKADVRVGSVKTLVNEGDLIIIPHGKKYEHELKVIGDQPMQLLVFGIPPEE
jgi:quercetin dioxygenase-like cupin family protein